MKKTGIKLMKENRIFSAEDISGNIELDCDLCVIGSGAGGAVAASSLTRKGYRVVLLEEGAHRTVKDWNGKPMKALAEMYRDGGSTVTFGNPFISITLGKCIGGTTTVNSATCFRTPDSVLQRWRDEFGLGALTPQLLEPIFRSVEKMINVTELSWKYLGNCAKIVKRGADKLGLTCVPLKHNIKNCEGCGTCQFGCLDGAKQSMDVTYIPDALKHGAQIYSECRAQKLIIEGGIVKGVRGRFIDSSTGSPGFEIKVNAKAVAVACGSLITPSFLKKNGLKNRNIGRHLQIHPAGRVTALMDEKVEGWKGVSQGGHIPDFEDEGINLEGIFVHPSLLLSAMPGIGHEHKELAVKYPNIAAFGVMVHDSTTGRVYKGRGSGIFASYMIKREDMEKFKRGIAYTARIFFAAGAKKVFTGIHSMPVLDSPAQVDDLLKIKVKPSHMEVLAFHPLGTARMSSSAKTGAIGPDGETFDVRNLYVVDASAIPTSLGVNPQITIMALSTYISEKIAEKLALAK